jgi:hypothetical protein
MPSRAPRPGARHSASRPFFAVLAAALLASTAGVAAACHDYTPATPTFTAYQIGPTVWPNGTVGKYGLRIDPTLLKKLPKAVGGFFIEEDAQSEVIALDDQDLPKSFDGYVAAMVGDLTSTDWLALVVVHRNSTAADDADFYQGWAADYAAGACSHASGVATTGQETINDWLVDTATCTGGVNVYTLSLGDGSILSMYDAGPRDLGRLLLQSLY